MEVLVAYATKNGSTEQVARAIAATFQDHGAQVTVLPARKARTPVTGYGLIVLGAPLYSGRWHGDARRFLKRHRRELAAVPAAVFAMGPGTTPRTPGAAPALSSTGHWPGTAGWSQSA